MRVLTPREPDLNEYAVVFVRRKFPTLQILASISSNCTINPAAKARLTWGGGISRHATFKIRYFR